MSGVRQRAADSSVLAFALAVRRPLRSRLLKDAGSGETVIVLLRGEDGVGAASGETGGDAASGGAGEPHRAAFDALSQGKATITAADVAALSAGSMARVVLENGFVKDEAGGISFESFCQVLRMFGDEGGGDASGATAPLAARIDFVFDVVAKSGKEDDRLEVAEAVAFLRKARLDAGSGGGEGSDEKAELQRAGAVEASFEAATAATGNDYLEHVR